MDTIIEEIYMNKISEMISTHFRLHPPALDGPGGCGWDAIVKNGRRFKNLGELGKTKMVDCLFLLLSCKIRQKLVAGCPPTPPHPTPYTHTLPPPLIEQ